MMKLDSPLMAASSIDLRNKALAAIAEALKAHAAEIFEANAADISAANEQGLPTPVIKRLAFNEGKLKAVLEGIQELISLPDPLGRKLLNRELDDGLTLTRISCPIGVIGVIFEARPDALVQISSLCIKSGNCAVLKGGRETARTNRILFSVIYEAAVAAGLPAGCLFQAEERSEIAELLECDRYVDLLIPRGSNAFVRYIMDNTRIPVMGHADGVCHIYVDRSADFNKAISIIKDAKTQYVSVCNAVETLLINKDIAAEFVPLLKAALDEVHVKLRGNKEMSQILQTLTGAPLTEEALMGDDDYHTEYLDYIVSAKLVNNEKEAIDHINRFGSHHTDCIITEDDEAAAAFLQLTDSANVYRNCSTRFADGFRYGFGAEVGISTSKLHARGPVGLEGLVTYKYTLIGDGHTVAPYADGTKSFHFKDL